MTHIHNTLLFLLLISTCVSAQTREESLLYSQDDQEVEKVYAVKPWIEGGASVAGLGLTALMFQKINDKERIDLESLRREDVPGYDRWAFPANPEASIRAASSSDYVFHSSLALPFTLLLHKKFRKDWADITVLYLEAQAISGLTYAVSPLGPNFTNRVRPLSYYPELDTDDRASGKNRNSFFSGHVSNTAVGTFFFAKVISDYNPQWNGKQRALAFGLASVPPVYVSIQRVKALKHFPSDTVVGFALGTFFGIMTPHVHKRWQENHRSSLKIGGSYSNGVGGAGLRLTF